MASRNGVRIENFCIRFVLVVSACAFLETDVHLLEAKSKDADEKSAGEEVTGEGVSGDQKIEVHGEKSSDEQKIEDSQSTVSALQSLGVSGEEADFLDGTVVSISRKRFTISDFCECVL